MRSVASQRRRQASRRIAVLTGTRAEFGLLESTLRALRDYPHVKLDLLVGGMHLLPRFGRTERQITARGWRIALRVPMQRGDDRTDDQARGLARGVERLARWMVRKRPDIVLVLGDRVEALAGALAATLTGRLVAHVHGGDRAAGDFDDSIRHAITKLAHLHFVASAESARRVRRLGEAPARIVRVGAPGLDDIRELPARAAPGGARAALATRNSGVVLFHASGRPAGVEERAMTILLDAVRGAGLRRVIIHPNSDRGGSGVRRAIARHRRGGRAGEVTVHRSMPRETFLRALRSARVLVGNSSAGLLEAPFLGTPAVNVGARQRGRTSSGRGVVHSREEPRALARALRRALRMRLTPGRPGPLGDGSAGRRIAAHLALAPLTSVAGPKLITY